MAKAKTFDQAQEAFREKLTRRSMDMYFKTGLDYYEDGMIGQATYDAMRKECIAFLAAQALKKKMTAAQVEAIQTAKLNGFDKRAGERVMDTNFPNPFPCYIVKLAPEYAVVVYEDDPLTVCSTGNYKGRFVNA